MAIAMQMPLHRKVCTYAVSGQDVTQVARYRHRLADPRPQSQILKEYLDLLNTSRGRQMDQDIFWSVYGRAASAPRLDKAATLIALEQLKTLAPNWSGYRASPIDRGVIQTAKEVVWALPSDIIETPKVVPMTRGRLQFEWHRGNRSLELEFADGDQIHYLKWDPDVGIEEEDVIPVNDVDMIHALLRWFDAEPGDG